MFSAYKTPPVKHTYYVVFTAKNGIVGGYTLTINKRIETPSDVIAVRDHLCKSNALDTSAVIITNIIRLPI